MKKLSAKDLIEFRRKSTNGKRTFVEKMKSPKIEAPSDGGGDYWITSISAVCSSFIKNDLTIIDEKIDSVREKLKNTPRTITRNMYQRNMQILETYKTMDSELWRPKGKMLTLKKSSADPIMTVKGLQIQARPSHIYLFGKKGEEKIGSIWFTAKIEGYKTEEVGLFCEVLYRFLRQNYSKTFQVVPEYCVAVDMLSGRAVNYAEIESGKVSQNLTLTIEEINKFM